jgi:tyrosyl-tRNA synthetase
MDEMTAADVVRLCAHYNVARMLERDDFAKRYASQHSIGVHEFLYPLVQAYDSVALRADIEVGGTDQRFNLLLGREIQKAYGQEPQVIVTLPLLEGMDGRQKMSKSLDNAIGIAEPPSEIFGKLMSISDPLMERYIDVLATEEVRGLRRQLQDGKMHPMEVKKRFASSVVARFYDAPTAQQAQRDFERRFQKGLLPEEIPTFEWPDAEPNGILLTRAMKECGLATSASDARRLIAQGAVRIDGKRTTNVNERIGEGARRVFLVQVGSRRVCSIVLRPAEGG